MTVEEVIRKFHASLEELYDKQEIKALTKNTLMYVLNFSSGDLLLKKKMKLSEEEIRNAMIFLDRLKKFEPFQYITGETEFLGLKFFVNKNVLIPRPETEELVEWIIKENQNIKMTAISILDIGTGSGCIAVSLKKYLPHSTAHAMDISKEALKVAKKNAGMNGTEIKFYCADILRDDSLKFQKTFDIIVSNPPYVTSQERSFMHRNVTEYEPQTALFVEGKNPVIFYDSISETAMKNLLNKNGKLYFELNERYGSEIESLLKEKGFKDVQTKKDMNGKNRMIRGVK